MIYSKYQQIFAINSSVEIMLFMVRKDSISIFFLLSVLFFLNLKYIDVRNLMKRDAIYVISIYVRYVEMEQ